MFTAPPRPNIDCITISKEILHLEGHPNRITGSKATAILLNGWTLPIGGACEGSASAAWAAGWFP